MKTLAKYHVCNHCVIGEKHLKVYLAGLVSYRDFCGNGPLVCRIHTYFQNFRQKWLKSTPYFRLNQLKNHTLWSAHNFYSLYAGVPPPGRNPLSPNINLYFVLTVFLLFPRILSGRICLNKTHFDHHVLNCDLSDQVRGC